MSDEIKEEIKTDHVPQLQPRGRKRNRPVRDPEKVVAALQEQNASLEAQLQNVMTMLLAKATDGGATSNILPPKPVKVTRPRGYQFMLERKSAEDGIPRQTTYIKTVPERWDNPDEPDPRYCVFCSKQTQEITLKATPRTKKGSWSHSVFVPNLVDHFDEYDLKGNIEFNEEQMRRIIKLHKEHLRDVQGLKSSEDKYERSCYREHFDFNARKHGRVPDVVSFRTTGQKGDPGIALSSEQVNERNEQQYRAKAEYAVANQGR